MRLLDVKRFFDNFAVLIPPLAVVYCCGKKSQKLLEIHEFEIVVLKVVFETFLQNGQNKIGKKVI